MLLLSQRWILAPCDFELPRSLIFSWSHITRVTVTPAAWSLVAQSAELAYLTNIQVAVMKNPSAWANDLAISTNLIIRTYVIWRTDGWRRDVRTDADRTNGRIMIRLICRYRVFIKYCVFSLKLCDFSELCQFCCSAGVLPAWCVYTHWHRGKTEKDQSPEYSKILRKNTIFNEHPIVLLTTEIVSALLDKICPQSIARSFRLPVFFNSDF